MSWPDSVVLSLLNHSVYSKGRKAAGLHPDLQPIFSSKQNDAFCLPRTAMIVGGIGKCNISLVNKVKLYCFSFSFEENREFPAPSVIRFRKSLTNRACGCRLSVERSI